MIQLFHTYVALSSLWRGGRVAVTEKQADLFGHPRTLPDGFRYRLEFLTEAEAQGLLQSIEELPFKEFEFHGFLGKRRVVSFGWRYDFSGGGLARINDMPDFLLPVRATAAAFVGLEPVNLQQVLVTEYRPGAAIGWHKDRSVFGDVIGISLLSACTFRFRRKAHAQWDRASMTVEPRSVYLLRGAFRSAWEHSIPAVSMLRYSLTFRQVLERA